MTTGYNTIQPPFTLDFRQMSKKELKSYFQWFHEAIPQRINELTSAVRRTPDFESWQPDYTPESLELLGNWLETQVDQRQRTQEEIQEIRAGCAFPIDVPEWDLSNRSFSLAIDVGMYLSQVLLCNHTSLKWDQYFGRKNDADYGQPVLSGFGVVPFNPVGILVTLMYGLANKKWKGARLREIYDIWSQKT